MAYIIYPLKGVNDIEFGMSLYKVRELIVGRFRSSRKGATLEKFKDNYPTDYYVDEGIFCFYDREGHLEALEFTEPARPLLGGLDMLGMSFREAAAVLARLDPNVESDLDSVWSVRLSLAVWKSDYDEPEEPADTFLVGRPGYYDDAK